MSIIYVIIVLFAVLTAAFVFQVLDYRRSEGRKDRWH